jgi:uroporphyrinogen decarboxylase
VPYASGVYNEIFFHPLADVRDPSELAKYPWPKPEWWDAEGLKREIECLDAHTPYAIALPEFGDPGGIFEIAWYMRGMERFLSDMVLAPDMAAEIMRRVFEFYMGSLEGVMAAAGERIDLVWTSDDIAHQRGPLMSFETWRTLVAPFHERFNRRVHELGARVMYHSCGAVRSFIPGLIGIGVDVLDVLQFSAKGMDPREIKASFGDGLCFHGGMDVQSTLPLCAEGEVARVTKERVEVLGRNGGYILSPGHNIQTDTPVRNILAMYAAAGSLVSMREEEVG